MKNRILVAAAVAAFAVTSPLVVKAQEDAPKEHAKKGPGGMFARADKDHDGKLTEAEFVGFASARMGEEEAKAQFKKLDKDGDGFVTMEEFRAGMPKGGKKKEQ